MDYLYLMDYKVISSCESSIFKAVEVLEQDVRREMQKGWKPIGGICVRENAAFQAMIKGDKINLNTLLAQGIFYLLRGKL